MLFGLEMCAGWIDELCRFQRKWPQNRHSNPRMTGFPPGKNVAIWHVCRAHGAAQHIKKLASWEWNCGCKNAFSAKIALFVPFGGPHPSPNYLQDPKPTFLALSFWDASNGISHNRLSRRIRVAKIRGAKHSVLTSEKQLAEFVCYCALRLTCRFRTCRLRGGTGGGSFLRPEQPHHRLICLDKICFFDVKATKIWWYHNVQAAPSAAKWTGRMQDADTTMPIKYRDSIHPTQLATQLLNFHKPSSE